jgi:glycosyltransferase involved in cell wall biosynthesis
VKRYCEKIFCVSDFQRSLFPEELQGTSVVCPPLYISDLFKNKRAKFKNRRLIYASHPSKGLKYLLDMLPRLALILRKYDSKLALVTGEEIWYSDKKGIGELERMLIGYEDVVDYVGAVSMPQLVGEMAKSSILAYPCFSDESFCMVSLFAQGVGLPIVTSDFAGMPETAQGQILISNENSNILDMGPMKKVYEEKFLYWTELLLSDEAVWNTYSMRGLRNPFLEICDYRKIVKNFLSFFHFDSRR